MMNVTDYTNIKTLLVKFKEKSDVLYAKAAALSNYATIEWVGTQIPSVGNGTVTIKQNGTSKGSFSMNQSGGATINLTDTTYSSLSAVSGGTDKSLVTTGEKYTWNNKQAAISDLATIRSNAATAYGWGDHSKAGYITGITKAMVEGVLTGNITSHTHNYLPLNGTAANAAQLGGKAASMYFADNGNRGAIDFDTQFINGFEYVSGISTNGGVPYAIIYTAKYGDAGMQANFGRDSALQYRSYQGSRWFDWRTVYDNHNANNTSTVWSAKRLATPDNLICPYTWEQRNDITGTLVLSLPYGFNSMMQCIELTVYDYSSVNDGSRGATKFFIDGYNYSSERWINPHAFRFGNKNVRVRLGYYNNKCCILIGETNTTWNYPRICVDKVYGSISVHANDFKDEDWSCAILQDESQITDIATASDTPLYAPCYTRSGRPYVTDNDVAAKYLKLTGGTITGSIRKNGPNITPFLIYNFSDAPSGGWARSVLECRVDDKNAFRIAPFGNYTQGATNNKIQYVSLGFAEYGGLNLRISDTSLTWGNDAIYHAGNANNISTDWTCKSLVANDKITAYNQLQFTRDDWCYISAGSTGQNGTLLFQTGGANRLIITSAGKVGIGTTHPTESLNVEGNILLTGDVKASGWCKAANGLLIEESGVYYTHHSQFGEIDIVKGNEFIWGGQTDTLYFNYRPSANKTTTVAHYVWNAGSSTTYATHTMGTLTVLGAITAIATIYAKTGIYTDGYISAKQASASSDRRLKKDFCKIDNALKYVLKTHYTRFRWKDDNKESIGIIAQEEQNREYGFLVQNNEKIGHLTYDYAASTALLGAAIQEEDSKVEKLKKRVAELEKELSNLKRKCQH